jgi:hypothetical protein
VTYWWLLTISETARMMNNLLDIIFFVFTNASCSLVSATLAQNSTSSLLHYLGTRSYLSTYNFVSQPVACFKMIEKADQKNKKCIGGGHPPKFCNFISQKSKFLDEVALSINFCTSSFIIHSVGYYPTDTIFVHHCQKRQLYHPPPPT